MSISDSEIIKAIREGRDQVVVKSIYDNVLPNVKKFIISNSGSVEDAMDLFHDALLVFFKLVIEDKFDPEKYRVYGFVYTICRNLWINQSKKKNHFKKWSEVSERDAFDETALEQLISTEKISLVQKLMQELGEKCVEVLTLFLHQELSYREIAQRMGFENENSAKVKAHRCRKALTDKIKSDKHLLEQLRN